MKRETPKIDQRTVEQLLQKMQSMAPFFTPEWDAHQPGDPGTAVMRIYLNMLEQVIRRLNQTPDKAFIAFLDMMGIRLQPAQSARVPVTFALAEGTTVNVIVPEGTELAGTGINADGEEEEVLFQTDKNLLVTPAKLSNIFSLRATADEIFQHRLGEVESFPFEVAAGENLQEHILYLAHSELLNITSASEVIVFFTLTAGIPEGFEFDFIWEYWDGKIWRDFDFTDEAKINNLPNTFEDTSRGFVESGRMRLRKTAPVEIAPLELLGTPENRWIRCRVLSNLSQFNPVSLPVFRTLRLTSKPVTPFLPEMAFYNDVPVKVEHVIADMAAFPIKESLNDQGNVEIHEYQVHEFIKKDSTIFKIRLPFREDKLYIADLIELRNSSLQSERRRIISVEPVDPSGVFQEVTVAEPLEFSYDANNLIRLLTAARWGNAFYTPADATNPAIFNRLHVHSIDGLDIVRGSRIYLDRELRLIGNVDCNMEPCSETSDLIVDIDGLDSGIRKPLTRIDFRPEQGTPTDNTFFYEGDPLRIVPLIRPFGKIPLLFDTFYIASDEVFSKPGATITINIIAEWFDYTPRTPSNSSTDIEPTAVLSWEYFNGNSWQFLRVVDSTNRFGETGTIVFVCPKDLSKIEVNGEEKFWIRCRIVDGDYGKEVEIIRAETPTETGDLTVEVTITKGKIHFPIINEISLEYEDIPRPVQQVLSINNLDILDHTAAANSATEIFQPFVKLPESGDGLFLGFSQALSSGPIRIFFDLDESRQADTEAVNFDWFYWNGQRWEVLVVNDGTRELSQIGILEFIAPQDMQAKQMFGESKFWLKGSVSTGAFAENPLINNILPNTTFAIQSSKVNGEILGSSIGTAGQRFQLLNFPVIDQSILVRELKEPREEERQQIIDAEGEDAIEVQRDAAGEISAVWVRWHEVADFDDSGDLDRHYVINRRLGIIEFGDGSKGLVPPPGGDNIVADYRFGGGIIGNILPEKITGLKNSLPFIDTVNNFSTADGGAETENLPEALERGPLSLKNRDRSVTPQDFESITRSAARKVKRAKCLPNINADNAFEPGWVTVLIVPESEALQPQATRELISIVEERLAQKSVSTLSAFQQIQVRNPDYLEVAVDLTIIPENPDNASEVEGAVRRQLNRYLHALTGGAAGRGWEFGRDICRSEIVSLVENIEGVDYVDRLSFLVGGQAISGDVIVDDLFLPFPGQHLIRLQLPETLKVGEN